MNTLRFIISNTFMGMALTTAAFIPSFTSAQSVGLSASEEERLVYGQQEERLARDAYQALYDQYGLRIFSNIAQAEDRHLQAVGTLLDAYGIAQTEGYGELQVTYDALIAKGGLSLQDALEVGITIEILDIEDLDASLAETTNADIMRVYSNLRKGSINHLNAFVRTLQRQGYSTDLDWEQFTSQEQVDTRGRGRSGNQQRGHGRRDNGGQRGMRWNR